MKKNNLILIFILLFLNNCIFSQYLKVKNKVKKQYLKVKRELVLYEVVDDRLLRILDSVIFFEKTCNYYNNNLIFGIIIKKYENYYEIIFSSHSDTDLIITDISYGYLRHQNHFFILKGDHINNLFLETKEKKDFTFFDHGTIVLPNGRRKYIPYHYIDDSHSQWIYIYKDGDFILELKGLCRNSE